jgi:hypothetical protein
MDGRLIPGLFLLLFFGLVPAQSKADSVNDEWSSTLSAQSMGNVGIASADDPTTDAFYNPAALARIKKTTIEIFNPQLDVGGGTFSVAHSIADWSKETSFSGVQPLIKANPGTASSMGFSVFPNVSAQNFSLGVLLAAQSFAYYDKDTDAYHYHSRKLVIPSLGLAASMLGGRFRFGAAVRGVQINETNIIQVGPTSTVSPVGSVADGFGVGLDAGTLLSLPWYGNPTLGFVARNIGGTTFPSTPIVAFGAPTSSRHELIRTTFDGGFSISPKSNQRDQFTIATDYRDATNAMHADLIRHVNLGFEYLMMKMLALRAGFSQGYWTAGFGLNAKSGSVDIGTYGEELSPGSYHGFGDRHYSIRLTRRF